MHSLDTGGINGQVTMSALGSGCACATAFIGHGGGGGTRPSVSDCLPLAATSCLSPHWGGGGGEGALHYRLH